MKFKHLLFGILLSTFFITNSYSLNLNKVYNIKTVSSPKLEINDKATKAIAKVFKECRTIFFTS